jgi:hypothetical protein
LFLFFDEKPLFNKVVMTEKKNCWEFKKCGRDKENNLYICPAVTEVQAHGINGGINGGRICWAVPGTLCNDEVQGTYAQKLLSCLSCEFRMQVHEEENLHFRHIYLKS